MTVNPLPPQAYTKETLQKAYTWLLNQGTSVKDMATSQDMLISMYLKAQRSGDSSLETPSIQNFKHELKNLAGLVNELQTPVAAANAANSPGYQNRNVATPLPPQANYSQATQQVPPSSNPKHSPLTAQLDEQSMMAIYEVKASLNLSTDSEALRALISLGYRQFKKI